MALPGQRAAQTSYRAAVQSSRAMGRAVADAGGLVSTVGFQVNGVRWVQTIGEDGTEVRTADTGEAPEGAPDGTEASGPGAVGGDA